MISRQQTMALAIALATGGALISGCGETDDPAGNQTTNQNNETTNQTNNETTNQTNNETTNQTNNETTNQTNNETTNQTNNETSNNNTGEDYPAPQAGQVLISEFMKAPGEVDSASGQWLELYNATDGGLDVADCEIVASAQDSPQAIGESLPMEGGAFVTIANGESPGFEPDLVLNGLSLAEGAGTVSLECDGDVISTVTYDDGEYYPSVVGASIKRDPDFYELGGDDPWLWCASATVYNGTDTGSPGEAGSVCPWINGESTDTILDLRTDAEEAEPTTLEGVLVTYTRPAIGADSAGFFIQASAGGSGLFVPVDEASEVADLPVRAGQVIDLEVEAIEFNTGITSVSEYGAIDVVRLYVPPSELTTDVTTADNLLSEIYKYDARMISAEFMILGDDGFSGPGFGAFPIVTEGMEDALAEAGEDDGELQFRVPFDLIDDLALETGCIVSIADVPMWRYWEDAQLSIWQPEELSFEDCPATVVSTAISTGPTSVQVRFSRPLAAVDAASFSINGLDVTAASVDGRVVTLETAEQSEAADYTLSVDDQLVDIWDRGVAAGEAGFMGYTPAPQEALDVVFSEIMPRFQSGSGDPGEYIEIHNPSDVPFNLAGCVLGKTETQNYEIETDVLVEPGDYALFTSSEGGAAELDEDDVFDFPNLVNGGGTIFFECGGTTIDELTYASGDVTLGVSVQKDPAAYGEANDGSGLGANWCPTPQESANVYWTGDADDGGNEKFGTPAAANLTCE